VHDRHAHCDRSDDAHAADEIAPAEVALDELAKHGLIESGYEERDEVSPISPSKNVTS
jgi:hypothetical protein